MNIRIDKYDKMYPIKIEDGWGWNRKHSSVDY